VKLLDGAKIKLCLTFLKYSTRATDRQTDRQKTLQCIFSACSTQ